MPMRRPQRSSLELLTLVAMAWGLMTAGLALLPALAEMVVDAPWSLVIAWGIVSLVWLPVEVVLRTRIGALGRFFLTLPLWLAAALCGFWIRTTLGI